MSARRRSPATWLTLALGAVVAALPTVSATRSLLVVTGRAEVDADAAARAGAGELGLVGATALRNAEGFALLVTLPAAVTGLVVLAGLAAWRPWAREAVFGVYGLIGALLCVFSLVGLAGAARNGAAGLLAGLVLVAVVGLAASPPVREDFERRRIAGEVRERRRREQARRTRSSPG